ncbi:MAG TPA: twin-arginine translocase subunit TatC [Anaerolineales bacterium]|nr:twin-arginine translocase subunit TatC [Anaerolineales bacterium]
MSKLLRAFWRVITFPFVLVFNIVAFPFRLARRAYHFLNDEIEEDHSLIDTFSSLATEPQVRASLWDHIEALRMHLLRAVLSLVVTVIISFTFTQQLIEFLAQPVGGLDKLRAIEVTESVGVFMRAALLSGIALALPYIAFEFWLFAAPGLKPRERKFGLAGIPLAGIFFIGGIVFCYYVLLPSALNFLLNFMGIQAELRPSSYFSFVTGLMFWIGVAFEFPLVIYILTSVGFVQPQVLAQQWRLAIVIISIAAAAITPTVDPVNMSLVMIPMSLLYFLSIGLSYIAYAGRNNRAAKAVGTESSPP